MSFLVVCLIVTVSEEGEVHLRGAGKCLRHQRHINENEVESTTTEADEEEEDGDDDEDDDDEGGNENHEVVENEGDVRIQLEVVIEEQLHEGEQHKLGEDEIEIKEELDRDDPEVADDSGPAMGPGHNSEMGDGDSLEIDTADETSAADLVLDDVAVGFKPFSGSENTRPNVRSEFLEMLISHGLGIGTAEVTAMAVGEDEIENLPPQMVQHLIAAILSLEMVFKTLQTRLAFLNANSQFLVQHALPFAQTKIQVESHARLSHVGHRYGNSALVKRISQALSHFLQRQLAAPFPWTY